MERKVTHETSQSELAIHEKTNALAGQSTESSLHGAITRRVSPSCSTLTDTCFRRVGR